MGYDIIEVNAEVNAHFELVKHKVEHKIPGKLHDPRITKVWLCKEGYHDWLYRIHLETYDGHHHQHHFTVEFEVRGQHGGHVELIDVHEGFKAYHWKPPMIVYLKYSQLSIHYHPNHWLHLSTPKGLNQVQSIQLFPILLLMQI